MPSDTQYAGESGLRRRLDLLFQKIGRGYDIYLVHLSRIEQINRLEAKSDAQLAAMGLTRDQIVRYVFRDRTWI